jgi:hypothetical protein
MLVDLTLICQGVRFYVLGEPLLELLMTIKKPWHNKVEKSPKLSHGVLNGRSRQEKPISSIEL